MPKYPRMHVGLSVTDLAASARFYQVLLGSPPTKERAGYVKFEPDRPSLNLSLTEGAGARETSTHYGLEGQKSNH